MHNTLFEFDTQRHAHSLKAIFSFHPTLPESLVISLLASLNDNALVCRGSVHRTLFFILCFSEYTAATWAPLFSDLSTLFVDIWRTLSGGLNAASARGQSGQEHHVAGKKSAEEAFSWFVQCAFDITALCGILAALFMLVLSLVDTFMSEDVKKQRTSHTHL